MTDRQNTVGSAVEAALTHHRAGRLAEAEAACRRALTIDPDHPQALTLLADVARTTGHSDAAVGLMERAIAASPGRAQLHFNLGEVLRHAGRLDAARDAYRRAVDLKPDYVIALHNLSGLLVMDGQLTRAVALFRRALEHKPESPELHYNLGIALERLEDSQAAIEHYARAVALRPNYSTAHHNLANVLRNVGRFDEAVAAYRASLAADPDYADVRQNLGTCLALMGQWKEGLSKSGWGWQPRTYPQPRWDGTGQSGKTILLYAEQGLGDAIMFVRYTPLVRDKVGRVVVECKPSLARILANLDGVDDLVVTGQTPPDFDLHASLASLPHLLGTTPDTVPAPVPYLAAEAKLVELWRDRLASIEGLRIGISWQGSPTSDGEKGRSIPLACFAAFAGIPGVHLIGLQKFDGRDQIDDRPGNFPLVDVAPELDAGPDAFIDTAAVMANLDLVITSDTAIAHLAGALGCPVWVALQYVPDWRWLLDRDDSPWYPTMRLFRQPAAGDWIAVFESMVSSVKTITSGKTT